MQKQVNLLNVAGAFFEDFTPPVTFGGPDPHPQDPGPGGCCSNPDLSTKIVWDPRAGEGRVVLYCRNCGRSGTIG